MSRWLQIVLWTSGIVVLSLLINAPLIPLLLKWTGLCNISAIKVSRLALSAEQAIDQYGTFCMYQSKASSPLCDLQGVSCGAISCLSGRW